MHWFRAATAPSTWLAASLLVTGATASPAERRAANPTVTIPSGVIIGTATSVSNQPQVTQLVSAYLGIPFAAVPTGTRRFASPVPAPAWQTIKAQTIPNKCPELFTGGEPENTLVRYYFEDPEGIPPPESEDCLYLNIYAPPGAKKGSNLPVLLWIFGGNLEFGSAGARYYNGSSLAVNENVIVVGINFRNNIFGFPNSPELPHGGANLGFLDQRFALDWVQKNIGYFGGDASRVTLFGVSAGAESIKQLLANPPQPSNFHAAILESAGGIVVSNGTGSWKNVTTHFKCNNAASPLKCMQKIPYKTIIRYMTNKIVHFPPVNDGLTYVTDPTNSFNTGKFSKVPTLIGTNLNEATVLIASTGISNSTEVLDTLLKSFGIFTPPILVALQGVYPGDTPYQTAAAVGTDIVYTCPNSNFANQLHSYGNLVWRYQYQAAFPNTQWFPGAGAYHSSEVSTVFGSYPITTEFGTVTDAQRQLSSYMQGVWAAFAANPTTGVPWPRIQSFFNDQLGYLGGSNNPGGVYVGSIASADHACPFWVSTGAESPFSF